MKKYLGSITLVVRDYDEAIAWYRDMLGFAVIEDAPRENGKRWVRISPPGAETALLLAQASTVEQETRIGNQTGGRVGFFLHTDDFQRDYVDMQSKGVIFTEEPRHEDYGTVAVFLDIYGNRWDLLGLTQ